MKTTPATVFATFAGVLTLVGIVAGFVIIPSPSEFRARRLDEKRVQDLRAIFAAVTRYRHSHQSLPETLDALAQSPEAYVTYRLEDPEGRPYEYRVKDAASYELCADFARPAAQTTETPDNRPIFARHGQGRQCFTLEAGQ